MAEGGDESKNHAASEQKLRKARRKGDVPVTKEPGHMASWLALLAVLTLVVPGSVLSLVFALRSPFDAAAGADVGAGLPGMADLFANLSPIILGVLSFLGKVMAVFLAGTLVAAVLQGPFVVSAERIRPKLSKISPMAGAKRLFGPQNLVEFAKNLTKLIVLTGTSVWLVWGAMKRIVPVSGLLPEIVPDFARARAAEMLVWICVLMFPVLVADFAWKRISYARKQKMSDKEVKDERKDSDGDPYVKSRRDSIRRAAARQRLATAVPTATFVVTNPTHYAVALRYERGQDMAPVCVAKGADLIAAKIRQIAHEHEIPVIESVALARALHATVEIDQPIPQAHWAEVAELVGFVYDLRKRIRRRPVPGTSLRTD